MESSDKWLADTKDILIHHKACNTLHRKSAEQRLENSAVSKAQEKPDTLDLANMDSQDLMDDKNPAGIIYGEIYDYMCITCITCTERRG